MTPREFIRELEVIFEKNLKPEVSTVYEAKLARYPSANLAEILNKVLEEVPRFPKISDIVIAGRALGIDIQPKTSWRVHSWEPTDCLRCAGSGRVAAFYSQSFEKGTPYEIRKLELLIPYEQSAHPNKIHSKWDRYLFRCSCGAGAAETLEKGIPRWSQNVPPIVRRAW